MIKIVEKIRILTIFILVFSIFQILFINKVYADPSIPMYHLTQPEINNNKIIFTVNFSPDPIKALKIFSSIDSNNDDIIQDSELKTWSEKYAEGFKVKLNNVDQKVLLNGQQITSPTKAQFVDNPDSSLYTLIILTLTVDIYPNTILNEVDVENKNSIDGTDNYGYMPVVNEDDIAIVCQPMPQDNKMIFKYSKFDLSYQFTCDSKGGSVSTVNTTQAPKKIENNLLNIAKNIFTNPISFLIAMLLSIFFGMQHALLPGHAKTLVFVMSTDTKNKNHFYLAAATAISHGLSDILLGFLIIFITDKLKGGINESGLITGINIFTSLIVIGIGISYIYKGIKSKSHMHQHLNNVPHSHDGIFHTHNEFNGNQQTNIVSANHDHLNSNSKSMHPSIRKSVLIGIVSGLAPSITAISVLVYTYVINQLIAGILIIIFYSIGFSLVMLLIAFGVKFSKKILNNKLSKVLSSPKFITAEMIIGGIILMGAGIIAIFQNTSSPI